MHLRSRLSLSMLVVCASVLCVRHVDGQCQITKLLAPNGAADDRFGYSAAMAGGFAYVGAIFADDPTSNFGAAYAFSLVGIPPDEGVTILPSGPGGTFGRSLDADGNRLVVGASGAAYAYVFERNGEDVWVQVAQLRSDDWEELDFFAWSVGISGDTVVVGSRYDSNENGGSAGSAYVFERDPNGGWVQTQKLIASDGQGSAEFGIAVAIDGDVIVSGAWRHWISGYPYAGKAYVFERDPLSGVWTETARLRPPVSHSLQSFGLAVAVGGETAMIAAPNDYTAEPLAGAVYVVRVHPFAASGAGSGGS